jgi:hypothetical protein
MFTLKIFIKDNYFCKLCDIKFYDYNLYKLHNSRKHKISKNETYINSFLDGYWTLCKCGCGNKVKDPKIYITENGDWQQSYIRGHASRIKNNWGHNKKALEKSAKFRVSDEYKQPSSWLRGVTMTIEERKIKVGNLNRNKKLSKETRQKLSDTRKRNIESGKILILRGKDAPNWRGGYSSIRDLCYSSKLLYTEWKFPILIRDKFTCQHCGSNKSLTVHHNQEKMSTIYHKLVSKDIDATILEFYEKQKIAEKIAKYHIDNNVSGITLCKSCHKKEDKSYNFK